ncbi:MAG: DUF3828 domain-containing protein, partial [Pseudomonadota bacterium]
KDLEKKSAQATIEKFYRGYLKSPREAKELRFSKSYQEIAKLNKRLCSAQKQMKCGFDGDIYLNAQDYAANLTYESSQMSISQPTEDTVVVTFSIFPGDGSDHDRKITYKMIIENNQWAVDDMIAGEQSSRQYLKEENSRLAK